MLDELRQSLIRRRDSSADLWSQRRDEFERKFGANERMSPKTEMAYWIGFYAGQADAYRTVVGGGR